MHNLECKGFVKKSVSEVCSNLVLVERKTAVHPILDLGLRVVYAPMVMVRQWYEVMGELRETLL